MATLAAHEWFWFDCKNFNSFYLFENNRRHIFIYCFCVFFKHFSPLTFDICDFWFVSFIVLTQSFLGLSFKFIWFSTGVPGEFFFIFIGISGKCISKFTNASLLCLYHFSATNMCHLGCVCQEETAFKSPSVLDRIEKTFFALKVEQKMKNGKLIFFKQIACKFCGKKMFVPVWRRWIDAICTERLCN